MTTHVPLIGSRGESYPPKILSERGNRNVQNSFTLNVGMWSDRKEWSFTLDTNNVYLIT